ncbi:hypothetical protein MPLDJ20_130078 [Mesorhizobium plurifarium]|uniref:Uncharacterized protein n=1 Tax=Mesorhizobium plurifarium TaxID=69974 RepID=A0A090EIM8_MESPL|nr:hypothetical protein MPLDJ20_130078 [Mesorhizobium plurifarium]
MIGGRAGGGDDNLGVASTLLALVGTPPSTQASDSGFFRRKSGRGYSNESATQARQPLPRCLNSPIVSGRQSGAVTGLFTLTALSSSSHRSRRYPQMAICRQLFPEASRKRNANRATGISERCFRSHSVT